MHIPTIEIERHRTRLGHRSWSCPDPDFVGGAAQRGMIATIDGNLYPF
ncbi:MAG: hypothetical protein ACI83E_002115 [Sulfitobacter sp.]